MQAGTIVYVLALVQSIQASDVACFKPYAGTVLAVTLALLRVCLSRPYRRVAELQPGSALAEAGVCGQCDLWLCSAS